MFYARFPAISYLKHGHWSHSHIGNKRRGQNVAEVNTADLSEAYGKVIIAFFKISCKFYIYKTKTELYEEFLYIL